MGTYLNNKFFVRHPKKIEWGIGRIEKRNQDGTFIVQFSKSHPRKFDPKLMPVQFEELKVTPELLIQFHQERIEAQGKAYKGLKKRDVNKPLRVTHCYSCKERLDNSIDVECASCNWIICWCGACGCGFDQSSI